MPRRIRGESKGERQIQPVICSLSVLYHLEHTKRFTELGREEKGEGGDRGDLVEKLFIFNIDVLSVVLYRRRSFETTVKIRPITGSRRLKSKP